MTTINLKDDLVALMREVDEPVDRVAQEMIVLELCRRRIISSGRASELLGMSKRAFVQFAGNLGIPFLDLSPEELELELQASRESTTSRQGSLADFLASSPLRGAEIDLERVKDQPRELDL
jgi:predicted HTH domain antitoxin